MSNYQVLLWCFTRKDLSPPHRRMRTRPRSNPWVHCPVCGFGSRRSQERDRHMFSHISYWIACSLDACRWRGDRRDTFKKHLWDEHQTIMSDGHGYQLYVPKLLLKGIVKGSISFGDAEQRAITEVKEMAQVLSKQELLEDPSGRKGRSALGSQESSLITIFNAVTYTTFKPEIAKLLSTQ
ncbi:hypothetical protein EI94DRAFT_1128158 [Lactarius quietus]|nr:hypothetical protein EI94DRAFT_1128158 [Lactarius quietus]